MIRFSKVRIWISYRRVHNFLNVRQFFCPVGDTVFWRIVYSISIFVFFWLLGDDDWCRPSLAILILWRCLTFFIICSIMICHLFFIYFLSHYLKKYLSRNLTTTKRVITNLLWILSYLHLSIFIKPFAALRGPRHFAWWNISVLISPSFTRSFRDFACLARTGAIPTFISPHERVFFLGYRYLLWYHYIAEPNLVYLSFAQ